MMMKMTIPLDTRLYKAYKKIMGHLSLFLAESVMKNNEGFLNNFFGLSVLKGFCIVSESAFYVFGLLRFRISKYICTSFALSFMA